MSCWQSGSRQFPQILFESLAKVILVGIANVLDGKVVDNECKHDRVPFVAPEPGGGGCLVVVKFGKAVLEEFVGKDACLGETVHAMAHLELDPGVTGKLVELVLVDQFLGGVRKLDADVLWPVDRGVKIEVLDVHGGKPGVTLHYCLRVWRAFFLVASGTVVVCKNYTRVLGRSEENIGIL
jgi:hypothetical protein